MKTRVIKKAIKRFIPIIDKMLKSRIGMISPAVLKSSSKVTAGKGEILSTMPRKKLNKGG